MAKKMKKKRETEKERMERKEKMEKKREKKLARKIAKREAVATVNPVEPEEPVVDEGVCDEVCEEIENIDLEELSAEVFEDTSLWWDVFDKLKSDQKPELLYATFEKGVDEEFWGELELFDAVRGVFDTLIADKQIEAGITLLETLKKQVPGQYMDHFPHYDCNLLYYYAPLHEDERIDEIIGHFEKDPGDDVYKLFVALNILRLYGMADGVDRLSTTAYQKLKDYDLVTPSGLDELLQLSVFCAFRKYATSPDYGKKEAEAEFYRELDARDFWEYEAKEAACERLRKNLLVLRGELEPDWKRGDFLISDGCYRENVVQLGTEFVRYLYTEKSIEWVTGDLLCELAFDYFGGIPERRVGFYFSFSKNYLDKYLGGFFGFFKDDAKAVAALKAVEYFCYFLYERGIYDNRALKEVKRAMNVFSEPMGDICERNLWKCRFVEMWE
ncbi:MAG: hypothetical protein U9N46_13050 [Euryarchaeota archaeon]|nr:hypothetical protein [Euryarchaeota archaeon]